MDQWLTEEVEAFSNNLEEYIAAFYNDPTWEAFRARTTRMILTRTRSKQVSVLDLGSGPIPSLPGLYERASRYFCVEPSMPYVAHLQKYYPRATVIQESVEALNQFEKEPFDVVLSFGLLHHLYSPIEMVASINKWLNKDGIFVAHEPSNYWNGKMGSPNERGFSRQEFLSMIELHFTDVNIYSRHFPHFRQSIYRFLSTLKLWPFIRSQELWKIVIEMEFAFDKLGVSGTNFLVLATAADLGVVAPESAS